MAYVSARYMPDDPLALPGAPKQVQATDDSDPPIVWSLTEDSDVGDWLDYLARGGVIDPYEPTPQEKLAAVMAERAEVPVAQPEVVYDIQYIYTELESLNARVTALEQAATPEE